MQFKWSLFLLHCFHFGRRRDAQDAEVWWLMINPLYLDCELSTEKPDSCLRNFMLTVAYALMRVWLEQESA